MACTVEIRSGLHAGAHVVLDDGRIVVGSGGHCDIVLCDEGVAEEHLAAEVTGRRVRLTALGHEVRIAGAGTIPAGHAALLKAPVDIELADALLTLGPGAEGIRRGDIVRTLLIPPIIAMTALGLVALFRHDDALAALYRSLPPEAAIDGASAWLADDPARRQGLPSPDMPLPFARIASLGVVTDGFGGLAADSAAPAGAWSPGTTLDAGSPGPIAFGAGPVTSLRVPSAPVANRTARPATSAPPVLAALGEGEDGPGNGGAGATAPMLYAAAMVVLPEEGEGAMQRALPVPLPVPLSPSAAAADELRAELAAKGLTAVRVEESEGLLVASGTLGSEELDTWTGIEHRFDARHAGRVALVRRIAHEGAATVPPTMPPIQSVWMIGTPFLTIDGAKYSSGDVLPNGWRVAGIGAERASFERDGVVVDVVY